MYVYVCVCTDVHVCIYMHVYMYMCTYACICICMCMCMQICAQVVSLSSRFSACLDDVKDAHGYSCGCVCICICVCVCICVQFLCREWCVHFTGVVGTSAWTGVYVTLTLTYTSANTLAAGCAHMCICIYMCICMHMYVDAYVLL